MPGVSEIPLLSLFLYLFSETGTKWYFGTKHMLAYVVYAACVGVMVMSDKS